MCSSSSTSSGALAEALDALAGADLRSSSTVTLGADLVDLGRQLARLEGEWLRRLERFDRAGGAAADGAASTAAWLRHHCRISPGESSERVSCARRLADALPDTARALSDGEISYRHAAVLSRTTADVESGLVAQAEATLVDAARRMHPRDLRRVAVHWRHVVDAEMSLHDAQATHERRYLSISTTLGGTVALDGLLGADDAPPSSPP